MSTTKEPKPVPAIVRFAGIMDALSRDPRPRGVSELARELGLPRSTVHSLCHTLVELGTLTRVGTTAFAVGPGVLSWAVSFENRSSITQVFSTLAGAMTQPEALNLSMLTGREVMYIGHREGSDPLAVRFREGMRFFAPYTATGKAILSTFEDDEIVALMGEEDWPQPPAANSLRSTGALLADLAETRRRGYSIDDRELRDTLISCGAPVFTAASDGHAAAGVSIAMIADRGPAEVERAGLAMLAFASEFSRRLGGSEG